MPIRLMSSVAILVLVAGCTSPPSTDAVYEQTAYNIRVAAAGDFEEPATLPLEAELNEAHRVDFYVQLALERNPEILAARRSVAAQAELIPQVTALDDPVLTDAVWPESDHSPQTASGRMPNTLTLAQRFPWFGKLRLRGEVAEQATKIALTRLAQAELKVVEDVKLAYYELYFNQRAIEITQEDEKLLRDLVRFAGARYRTGAVSQQDVLRAQLELDKVRDRLIILDRQLGVSQADLAKSLHSSPEANLKAADVPPALEGDKNGGALEQIDRLYDAAIRCRPELQERLYAIVQDQRARELATLEYYPDVTLGVGWQAITTDSSLSPAANGHDNVGLTLGVNLPIWRDKLRAGVREAEQRVIASARQYDAVRDDTFRLIRRLVVQARSLEEQIHLFRDQIIPRAEQTLRVSTADYRVGKVDFLQLIDNWAQLLAFQVQLARLESNLGQTLASLERVVGCQLASLAEMETVPAAQRLPQGESDVEK